MSDVDTDMFATDDNFRIVVSGHMSKASVIFEIWLFIFFDFLLYFLYTPRTMIRIKVLLGVDVLNQIHFLESGRLNCFFSFRFVID